jgi:hypothetical protein
MTGRRRPMSETELDRLLGDWFDEGAPTAPDRIAESAMVEVATTRQERTWLPAFPTSFAGTLLASATAILAVAVGIGIVVSSLPGPTWRAFPIIAQELEPGRYLIADALPVRIGITVPEGWLASPTAQVQSTAPGGGALTFTLVEGVYADPCHLEEGLIDPPVGPTVDDLAIALAGLPSASATGPTETVVDGYPAVSVTLTAPASFADCTGERDGPLFRLWGVPGWHWLEPGERNRIWIVAIDGTRLVISAEEFVDSSPDTLAQLNAIIASIDLEPDVAVEPPVPSGVPFETLIPLPNDGPLDVGRYEMLVRLHRYAADGSAIPLSGPHRVTVDVPEGWAASRDTTGIHTIGASASSGVRLSVWSVDAVYLDPCHWRASELVDPRMLGRLDLLAEALWRWWAPDPDLGDDYVAPASAPQPTEPIDEPRYGRFGKFVELTVPPDIDLAACDNGEYRIWEDLGGRPRLANGAGERIRIWVVEYDPGLLLVDAASLPGTSAEHLEQLDGMITTIWAHPPGDSSGP